MALKTYKIGELVEAYNINCAIPNLKPEQISGVNKDKEFFEPAKQVGENTSNYKVVPPHYFACNLMHVGRDIVLPIALNHTDKDKYISPAYSVFRIKKDDDLIEEYFFILLKSSERDRYFWFHTDSSVRQGLPWSDFCDIELRLPPIAVQRRFVDVYLSLQNNLAVYQSKTDDLKQVCEAKIEELKKSAPLTKIGKYIEEYDEKNASNQLPIDRLRGISTDKVFIETKANMMGVSLQNYKIVRENTFAFVPDTSRRGEKIALALNNEKQPTLISSIYTTFRIKPEASLLPEYLFMYLSRANFDRYARFHSWGSAREVFTFADMQEVEIPIPPIDVQQGIVNIHRCMVERQRIAQKLKEEINHLCPILIKGSLEAGNSSVGTDEL